MLWGVSRSSMSITIMVEVAAFLYSAKWMSFRPSHIDGGHFPFSNLFLHLGSSLPRSSAGRVLKKS